MSQCELMPIPAPSVVLHDGRPATTSLEIAKFFKKRHDVVLRDVRNIMDNCPESFNAHNFVVVNYLDGKCENRPMFILFKDGFTLLVMGYRGPEAMRFKIAYIEAFNRMEAELSRNALPIPEADRPSRRSDPERKALTAIINTWVGMAPIHYASARSQVNAHFGVASVDALTIGQVRDAIQWVQEKIDALQQALPQATLPSLCAAHPVIDEKPFLDFIEEVQTAHEEVKRLLSPLRRNAARLTRILGEQISTRANIPTYIRSKMIAEGIIDALYVSSDVAMRQGLISTATILDEVENPGYQFLGIVRQLNDR